MARYGRSKYDEALDYDGYCGYDDYGSIGAGYENLPADMTITADIKSAVKKGSLYMISRRNPMKNAATTAGISKGGFAASLMNLMPLLRTGATAVTGLSRRGGVDLLVSCRKENIYA